MIRGLLRLSFLCALAAGWIATPLSAAAAEVETSSDAIIRAGANGEFARALQIGAQSLKDLPLDDPARVDILIAQLEVLFDSSAEWARNIEALHATVQALPEGAVREAVLAEVEVDETWRATSYAKALELAQAGLAKNFKNPSSFMADMHFAAARASGVMGQLDVAEVHSRAAMSEYHRMPGLRARRGEILLSLLMSNVLGGKGRPDEALAMIDDAARISAEAFGDDSAQRLQVDEKRALALDQLDRHSEARALREDVLVRTRKRFGPIDLHVMAAEGGLGTHLQVTGDYVAAREHYAVAEAVMHQLPDVSAQDQVMLNNNYANLLQEIGDEPAALAHYHAALDMVGENRRTRAIILTNIGNTDFRLGHYDQAVADFNLALPLREQVEGKDSPGLSYALEGLGSAALALKKFADAERHFARAIQVRSKGLAPNHSLLTPLNFGFALARWGQGENADAFRMAVKTAENQQTLLASLATEFSEQQSTAYDKLLVPATALAVTIAAEGGDAQQIATAWRLVMTERGLIGRAEARRLAIARASKDANLAQLYDAWRGANAALGDAWLNSHTSAEQMATLQTSAEAAERALWSRLGYRRDEAGDAAKSIADLARALPADSVLLAFSEGLGKNAARIVNAGSPQIAEDWYAFVLTPGAAPQLKRVGGIEALSAQIHAWYGSLRDPHSNPAQLRRRGESLRHDLFANIGQPVAHQTLFVVPQGELFRVNFSALPDGEHYLVENDVRVQTLGHESDLLLAAPSISDAKVVLAGAPIFAKVEKAADSTSRQLCARAADRGFVAIPGAARELDGLNTLLTDALGSGAQVREYSGAQATKERVLAALDGADIVHVATHGFSFDETCSDGAPTRGVHLDRGVTVTAPVTFALSGLAFTGADVHDGRAPIGVLSASELSTADLSRAGWVVLSSCDSGLGPIGRNEGVFGMRRALRLAGARTVVMSLWEADDATTTQLMQALYRARFVEHRAVAESMAAAMRATLAARRSAGQPDHPYYWAAFVSEGGWR